MNNAYQSILQQGLQACFVENRDAEVRRLLQFAARCLTGHEVVGLLGDGARDAAAVALDERRGILAAQARQGARDDERLAGEFLVDEARVLECEVDACRAEGRGSSAYMESMIKKVPW